MAQMRQEIMDSLRAELQSGLQSRVDQLENKCDLLLQENADLKRECKLMKKKLLREEAKVSELQGEVNVLQKLVSKPERKAKYLEMARKNKNWEYPLYLPDHDELLSLGYDEEESTLILDNINRLKDDTIKMRRCVKCSPSVDHGIISQYYAVTVPHFDEFVDALSRYRHTIDYMEDETFHFSIHKEMDGDVGLHKEVLDALQNALQHSHFHYMSIWDIENDEATGIHFITSCITADTRLKSLTLSGGVFENTRYINALCAAVNNHHSLQDLSLCNCRMIVGNTREIFNKLKSQTLEEIDIHSNRISNLRPGDISDFLSSNPSLSKLNLRWNPFNDQDFVYIADALRNNTSLRELMFGFDDPYVLPDNWHILASVVFDGTSLNLAYDSNHHCHLRIFRFDAYPISRFNMYQDPIMNRRKKIYYILSARNRNRENAAYFESDNIGIKHIPRILALLESFSEHYLDDYEGKEDDEVEPLSIAYEILRDWKMPELYNFLDVMEED
eukprot:scaffold64868_cov22-Cyclotella_meneghiniana.AAC.1